MHAGVAIPAHARDALERLLRYLARAPLPLSRLNLRGNGNVVVDLKRTSGAEEPSQSNARRGHRGRAHRLAAPRPAPGPAWPATESRSNGSDPEPGAPPQDPATRTASRRPVLTFRTPRHCTALPETPKRSAASLPGSLRNAPDRRGGAGPTPRSTTTEGAPDHFEPLNRRLDPPHGASYPARVIRGTSPIRSTPVLYRVPKASADPDVQARLEVTGKPGLGYPNDAEPTA